MALGSWPARAFARARPLRAVALAIPPYASLDASGRRTGLFVEAFELIARESRRQIDIEL
jgi:polar amino acid transport system substrate-binding protein